MDKEDGFNADLTVHGNHFEKTWKNFWVAGKIEFLFFLLRRQEFDCIDCM